MPRQIVHAKEHDRERSLGWLCVAWMEFFVRHGPGDVQGMAIVHGDEYTAFVVDCYALAEDGRRLYDSAFISRPKGCDKSGLGARLALFEGFGPCRIMRGSFGEPVFAKGGEVYRDPWGLGFEYEYAPGEPMGRPVQTPYIRCMATEEGQTGNVFDTIHYNLTDDDCPLKKTMARADDAGKSRILLPGGGEITPSTASSSAKDGGKETFAVFDETHLYNKPELRRMYKTVTRNLRKRKRIAETWYLETTTMYAAGEESVAEATYKLAQKIAEGTTRSSRLLLDHRWGDIDMSDLADEVKLGAALTDAYGDALEWNYLPGMIEEIFDERTDVEDSVRYFLNSQSSAENAWMIPVEWARRKKPERAPMPGEKITLGFDGSRGRMRGVADATALIGCCLDDGHIFEIGVWEQPAGAAGKGWEPPVDIIDSLVDDVFTRYKVVGFYADPAKWESHVANWERKYGQKLLVKSSQRHPIEWWMTGGRGIQTVQALQKFRNAVSQGEMSHDASGPLTRHILNSRRVQTTSGIQIKKENPDSPNKIDAAVAAVLAFTARLDALAVSPKEDKVAVGYRPRRLL